jgi:hypothetical protein
MNSASGLTAISQIENLPIPRHLFFEAPEHAGKTAAIFMALGDMRFSAGGFLRCRSAAGGHLPEHADILLSPARAASTIMPAETRADLADALLCETAGRDIMVVDEPTLEMMPAIADLMKTTPCLGALNPAAPPQIKTAILGCGDAQIRENLSFEEMLGMAKRWADARREELRQRVLKHSVQKSWDRDYLKAAKTGKSGVSPQRRR